MGITLDWEGYKGETLQKERGNLGLPLCVKMCVYVYAQVSVHEV